MSKNLSDELSDYVARMEAFSGQNSPSFLTPNSTFVAVVPGHNLDLLQITFDYRIDRTMMLRSEIPDALKDISKPDLKVIE